MNPPPFDWNRFHAYRVFDEFLERFVLEKKSYVTRHPETLDFPKAFEEIRARFIDAFDDSDERFEDKVAQQFERATEQAKIVFANVEYLWAMPVKTIAPKTKKSYVQRWFHNPELVVSGDRYFFGHPHIIANPGPWYTRNKYWEIVATLRVLNLVCKESGTLDLFGLKKRIAGICHTAIYAGVPSEEDFAVGKVCGVHSALLHLAAPERYEAIISTSHREQICSVFGHIVENPSSDTEALVKQIRETLYDSHGNGDNPDRKYRWFFYTKDVNPLWINKKTKKQQRVSSAVFDVRNEEDAADLEGDREAITGFRIRRSPKLVKATKERDRYTCRACDFHFEDQIVHVHHLDPLGEYKRPQETKLDDLVTLCPTCHYLAHYWLRQNNRYKQLEMLLAKLKTSNEFT